MRISVIITAAALVSTVIGGGTAKACTSDGKEGFLPENNLRRELGALNTSNIDEKKFNEIIDKIEAIYAPIVAEKGATLNVIRNWKDGTVNAYADRSGKTWNVHLFGGLARHEEVTEDGFALVFCHELGHHLGGAPKMKVFFAFPTWAGVEGEADYFATLKCLRKVFAKDENAHDPATPATVTEKCQKSFNSPDEIRICEREAMAGISLANLLSAISSKPAPQLDTPDQKHVWYTHSGHPAPQCRLDTYFQGSLCDAPLNVDMNDKDPTAGACAMEKGAAIGYRPLCWYKPKGGSHSIDEE
jgi:hypothetical protein